MLCIPKEYANKLREQFQRDKITMRGLYGMDSAGRRKVFEEHLDPETAKQVNILLEKAMLSNQKTALKNWIWKHLYAGTPLYSGISLDQASNLKQNLTIKQLERMTPDERIAILSEYLDPKVAERVGKNFGVMQKSGNLANWEKRALGTDSLFKDRKLKGAFARLETLDQLGVLTPPQMDKFMQDYVSDQMGVNLTAEESQEISTKVKAVSKAFEAVKNDWTAENEEAVVDYFVKRSELEKYLNKLDPEGAFETFFDVGARGSILFSLRSLANSFLYQVVPTVSQGVIKRITGGTLIPGDYGPVERITNAIAGATSQPISKEMGNQVKMAMKIYAKTGYDISRMESLDDGFRYFGEKFTHTEGPTFKEAEGIKEKLKAVVRGHAKLMSPGLKWAAGGTDTLLANIHRVDTTNLLSRTIAKAEKKAGKIEDVDARIKELYKDSLRPDPQTEEGAYIREMGILDANVANYTNDTAYGKYAMKFRDMVPGGIGKAVFPFLRIPANALGAGIEMTGPGLILGTKDIIKGLQMESGNDKQIALADGIRRLIVSGGGLALAGLFVGALLDDDDFIGAYNWKARDENALSTTKNGGANYIRIGGNWYSTKWLGPLGIPVSAIMEARQAKAKGQSAVWGYLNGIYTGAMQFPGLKESVEWYESAKRAMDAKSAEDVAKAFKATPSDIGKWVAVRTLTSTATNDAYGFASKPRYDALGRKVPHKSDSIAPAVISFFIGTNIKPDTSNAITDELDRLRLKGHLPSIANPDNKAADRAMERFGDEYPEFLNKLKQNYAKKVEDLIASDDYKKMSDVAKEKAIDRVRKLEILDPLDLETTGDKKKLEKVATNTLVDEVRVIIRRDKHAGGPVESSLRKQMEDHIKTLSVDEDEAEEVRQRVLDGEAVYTIRTTTSHQIIAETIDEAMKTVNQTDARQIELTLRNKYRKSKSDDKKDAYEVIAKKYGFRL